MFNSFTGPAVTNTPGKSFFTGKGVAVDAGGNIAANAPSLAALNALRAIQTFDDKKQGTLDAMAYSASVGVTTNVDMGGFVIPGTPNIQDSDVFDTLASWDPFTAYDPLLALHDEGKVSVRVRLFFLSMDHNPDVPLTTQRVLNAFSNFGDDMVRSSGIGEFATSWPLFGNPFPTNYGAALNIVAQRGWAFQQHSLSLAEDQFIASAFETVNKTIPIADLRWSDAHVPSIDQITVNRLKAIGAGIAVHPFRYLSGGTNGGPPLRMIIDSGIHVGAGSDSAQISTLDPWNMIYYMVTGKNVAGKLVNGGQQITREEAIRLYSVENGWFLKEENKLPCPPLRATDIKRRIAGEFGLRGNEQVFFSVEFDLDLIARRVLGKALHLEKEIVGGHEPLLPAGHQGPLLFPQHIEAAVAEYLFDGGREILEGVGHRTFRRFLGGQHQCAPNAVVRRLGARAPLRSICKARRKQCGRGRHAAALNFGDCMSYAAARVSGGYLLHRRTECDGYLRKRRFAPPALSQRGLPKGRCDGYQLKHK